MAKPHVQVAAGVVERDGYVLLAQRYDDDHYGGLWEFPGGAIEKNESPESAVRRELKEELGIDTNVLELLTVFDDEAEHLKITVSLYRCAIISGEPSARECQAVRWMPLNEVGLAALAPADRKAYDFLTKAT